MAADGMLPDALVPVTDEWYRLCERRFAVDRISISGKLAEAIVEAVGDASHAPLQAPAAAEMVAAVALLRESLCNNDPQWRALCTLMAAVPGGDAALLAAAPAPEAL